MIEDQTGHPSQVETNQKHYQELIKLSTKSQMKIQIQLTPNMCLFILNSNAVQSMNLQQPQKAKIINELGKIVPT